MNIEMIDELIVSKTNELIELKTTAYKAEGKDQYSYWAKELIRMTNKNTPLAVEMVKNANNIYLESITGKKKTLKDFFTFKDDLSSIPAGMNYELARAEYEKGLLEMYFASALAGAKEFETKIGIATTFSPADGFAIDHYKFLTEQRSRYLIDTDKKILSGILNTSNTEGLTLRETKKLVENKLTDVQGIASRSHNIAVTETSTSLNWSKFNSGVKAPIKMLKTWFTTGDKRVRTSHSILDGVTIPMETAFLTGLGNLAMYPADSDLSASDIVGCRCTFGMYPA